jgi:GT2 family glycosyltransferase
MDEIAQSETQARPRAAPAPAADLPRTSVIIPHYNDAEHLSDVLERLVNQWKRLTAAGQVEILVVDNGSPIDLSELKRAFPDVTWLVEPRKGAANARNLGVAESDGETLAFIDSDCIPADDWLATAISCVDRCDIVGGRVDTHDETPPPRSGAEAFERVFAFDQKAYITRKGFTGAGNFVVSRRVFEAVGGFAHGVSEDMDWCFRATRLGFRVAYADDLVVSHPTRADWPALLRKNRRITEETYGLAPNGAAWRLKRALRSLAVLLSIPVHTAELMVSPKLDGPVERMRGAATLVAIRACRSGWMLRQALTGRASLGG